MFVALVFASTYISYKDLSTHRILNRVLGLCVVIFYILSEVENKEMYFASAFCAALIALPLFALGMGAGDMKLATVLALFYLPNSLNTVFDFFMVFSLIAMAQLCWRLFRTRTMKGSIALAPAICGAVIWCAR